MAPVYAEHRHADPAVLRALIARVTSASRVLEVGSGTGNYAIAVAEATGARCVGVEPSDEMRAVAESRSAAVEFVAGKAEKLPFAGSSFDVVYFVQVLHHLDDVGAALAEAARVLAPGGVLGLATDDRESISGRIHRRYFPATLEVELARYPTLDELDAALRAAGLEPRGVERTATPFEVTDVTPFRTLAFSSLALIPPEALEAGLEQMERDLERGPIEAVDSHVLVWASKP